MSNVRIAVAARRAVINFLSDPTVGFNPTLLDICTDSEIPNRAFTIDFVDPNSKNFFQGFYAAKDLIATSNVSFPAITLYTIKTANTNNEKFHLFSGSVMLGLDTYVSFPQSKALPDSDDLCDCVEDTYYNLFHGLANQAFWTNGVTYNGDLYVTRGPVLMGGPNWIQLMQARLTVDIDN
jgi:hypothetical protein